MPAAKRSPSSSSDPISSDRIRRRRVTTACITCRDRRVKCDRSKPICTQCLKGGRECKYVDTDVPKIEFVTERRTNVKSEPVPADQDADADADANPDGMTGVESSDTWRGVIEAQNDLVKASSAKKGPDMPSWAVAEAEEPMQARAAQVPFTPRPYVIPVGSLGEEFLFALTNKLPSQEACQPYFESFLLGVHPVVPVCHGPTLRQEYLDFWTNLSPSTSVETLVLMLAVLYTGATNITPIEADQSSTFLRLYEEIFCMIDISLYHVRHVGAAIHLLQGYLIMNTYKASNLAPFSAFGFMPQTIRYAQSLRLHVEPKTGTQIDQEVRRRLWWHLVFLDMESIIASGLPPIIRPDRYTTQLPSLLYDHAIGDSVNGDAVPRPGDFSPMMVAMQGHYQWGHQMQLWFERLPPQEEVLKFKALIDNLLLLIPDNESPENSWARTYLKMQVDRAYCMLGLRFWQLDKYEKTGCQSEVVKTARSFLTHYLTLSRLSAPNLNLEWFIPGTLQPLHGLIITLLHLSYCPSVYPPSPIPNACLSSRSLLDSVHSLRVKRILAGNVVPTKSLIKIDEWPQRTNPRYLILVNLRKRVWRKIGWDRDGEGVDPWGGRLEIAEAEEWKMAEQGEGEWKRLRVKATELASEGERSYVEQWNGELSGGSIGTHEGSWGLSPSDGVLEGGTGMGMVGELDLLGWDEWEGLTQGLFAS